MPELRYTSRSGRGTAAVSRYGASTLTAKTADSPSAVSVRRRSWYPMAALWITASNRPAAAACSATARMPTRSVRSPTTTPSAAGRAARASSARDSFRACRVTACPSSASSRAARRPRPSVEPVMRTRDMLPATPSGCRRCPIRTGCDDAGMAFTAAEDRYDSMTYRRTGRSGLDLPAISLGLWHNFGDDVPLDRQRDILRRAFDLGITHFDLANNYGPPYGSAETNFGRHLRDDFRPYRDELVISTKAGYDMWPGPYGQGGGSRKYVLASLDQSLARLGLEYVDIFYSHRPDPSTPLEETMGALDTAVRSGKALYAGISSYSPQDTARAADILADLGTPLLIHQPSYSMLNRWIETEGLLDVLQEKGVGCIAFSPLAQGMLTDRYLNGVPEGSRASQD